MACKRPAPDGGDAFLTGASPCCKKPRPLFTSIFNYEYLHKLGAGSYGVVYKAHDRRTGETVAVKWVRPRRGLAHGQPADLAAFARERDCLAACRGYPSIVQLRDVAANPSNWDVFIVMEFVGANSLRDFIAGCPFSEGETPVLMRRLLAGVRAMHRAGMAHRDIKPGNILGPAFTLKICDFGMATTVPPPYEPYMVGTLYYNSPEQLTEDGLNGQYDGKAVDMWVAGCVMAELLTGDKRMTAEAALEHRWFTEEADSPAVLSCLAAITS
uniref:[RNA-polymerase]-subunit kinase n=1 Tax=Oryza glumipatula TaxID=40148 RepID=A0A0E0BAN1_9ORYZ